MIYDIDILFNPLPLPSSLTQPRNKNVQPLLYSKTTTQNPEFLSPLHLFAITSCGIWPTASQSSSSRRHPFSFFLFLFFLMNLLATASLTIAHMHILNGNLGFLSLPLSPHSRNLSVHVLALSPNTNPAVIANCSGGWLPLECAQVLLLQLNVPAERPDAFCATLYVQI